ncbi:MAG: hypothetical protein V5B35_12720 [Candidatus Accumulibacter necessarius]
MKKAAMQAACPPILRAVKPASLIAVQRRFGVPRYSGGYFVVSSSLLSSLQF